MPFQAPGAIQPQQQAPGGLDNSDELEQPREAQARFDVLKHDTAGTYIEGLVIDYDDTVPDKDPVTGNVKTFDGKGKTQDVITLLVTGGNAVAQPPKTPKGTRTQVQPGGVVTEWINGHNRYDPNRPSQYGMSWRVAKDTLGRGLRVGDMVRVDLVLITDKSWDGKDLGISKKVRAYQVAAPSTAEEFQMADQARAMRQVIKSGGALSTAPSQPAGPAAVPQAQAQDAPANRGLFG